MLWDAESSLCPSSGCKHLLSIVPLGHNCFSHVWQCKDGSRDGRLGQSTCGIDAHSCRVPRERRCRCWWGCKSDRLPVAINGLSLRVGAVRVQLMSFPALCLSPACGRIPSARRGAPPLPAPCAPTAPSGSWSKSHGPHEGTHAAALFLELSQTLCV